MKVTRNPAAVKAVHAAAERAVEDGAEFLLEQANRTVPIEEATLERSGQVTTSGTRATVSYDTPYAVRQHEDTRLRHDSGRRAKWLERTLDEERPSLLGVMAAAIQDGPPMIGRAFAIDLADNVDGLTFDPDGIGGNVFTGREVPSSPDVAVQVVTSLVPTFDDLPHAIVAVQVLARGERRSESEFADLCLAITDHFDARPAAVIGAGPHTVRLVGCSLASEASLPLDANERPEASINFRARIHRPTANRPE